MRFVYIIVIAIVTVAVFMFKYQGVDQVTVSFLSQSLTLPIAALVFVVYLLGIVAGAALLAVLRGRRTAPKRY
jgi:putative membrane protein